ncbi:unnamed protein product [Gadus morhua 'NCC']
MSLVRSRVSAVTNPAAVIAHCCISPNSVFLRTHPSGVDGYRPLPLARSPTRWCFTSAVRGKCPGDGKPPPWECATVEALTLAHRANFFGSWSDSYRPVVGYLLREEGLSGAGRLYVRADVSFGTEDDGGRTC